MYVSCSTVTSRLCLDGIFSQFVRVDRRHRGIHSSIPAHDGLCRNAESLQRFLTLAFHGKRLATHCIVRFTLADLGSGLAYATCRHLVLTLLTGSSISAALRTETAVAFSRRLFFPTWRSSVSSCALPVECTRLLHGLDLLNLLV